MCVCACVCSGTQSFLALPPLRSSPLPMPAQLDFLCHGSLRCICLRRCRLCLRCQCRCVHVCACTCAQCDGRKDEWTATPEVPPGVQHRVCMCVCFCVCSCTHSFLAASMGIIIEHRLLHGGYQNVMKLQAKSNQITKYFVSCETTQMGRTTIFKFSVVTPFMKNDSKERMHGQQHQRRHLVSIIVRVYMRVCVAHMCNACACAQGSCRKDEWTATPVPSSRQ